MMTGHCPPMTITEKIIAAHANREFVEAGEIVLARVDFTLANDITGPIAIKRFEELGERKVFDRSKIALVPDHFVPNKDVPSAEQAKLLKDFAARHEIIHYFEVGRMGVEHALLPELGVIFPGSLVIGADSHTCTYGALGAFSTGVGSTDLACAWATGEVWLKVPETSLFRYHGKPKKWVSGKDLILYTIGEIGVDGATYKAMEFTGDAISHLSMDSRFTMANMAVEAGAKNGIFPPDSVTMDYVNWRRKLRQEEAKNRTGSHELPDSENDIESLPYSGMFQSDAEARYSDILDYDLAQIDLQVSLPHSPQNARAVTDIGDMKIDQVVIGSCTNGRLEDLQVAAQILKGHRVHPEVRLIVIPATQEIYARALREGLIEVFLEAQAAVSTPTCGPCLGGYMGILAAGERAVATTNRNFLGRMGHSTSEVFLAGPAVAAASAVKGRIAHPDEVVGESRVSFLTPAFPPAKDDNAGANAGDSCMKSREDRQSMRSDGFVQDSNDRTVSADRTSRSLAGTSASIYASNDSARTSKVAGRVWKFGANMDTDIIIPAKYLNTSDPETLARHAFEDLRPDFPRQVKASDIIVAGPNFGCGSSREHAPISIKATGVSCVIAASFARIFFRNALNIGLPILESEAAFEGTEDGDEVTVDLIEGTIENVTRGLSWQAKPLPPFIRSMIAQGGLVPYTKTAFRR